MVRKLTVIFMIAVLLCGCTCQPPIRQPTQNIARIKLIHNLDDEPTSLGTLTGDEIGHFMDNLLKLECRKRGQPIGESSELEIWIYYTNGDVDIIGSKADRYIEQGELEVVGWHYYREDELRELISAYVD